MQSDAKDGAWDGDTYEVLHSNVINIDYMQTQLNYVVMDIRQQI